MTVLNIDDLFSQAEVLDPEEVAELTAARKSTALAAKLVDGFDSRDEQALFVAGDQLGTRRTRDDGEQPYDLKALQTLAGQARKYAKTVNKVVNAEAKRNREGDLGIAFTKAPPKEHAAGRPAKGSPADEAE
jgi:hypothetical protein